MIKKITIIFSSIVILLIAILIYLNFYGIETSRFNSLIKNEIKSYDSKFDIKLRKVKLLLDLKNLAIKVETLEPKIIYTNREIYIKKLSTIFSIKSYFNKNFVVKNLLIFTQETSIKDLINISRSIKNSPQLFIASQVIKKGTVDAIINLSFDEKGKIKSDYKIKGSTKDLELKLPINQNVQNIMFDFHIKDRNFKFENIYFSFNKIKFYSESIFFNNQENNYFIKGNLKNNEAYLNSNILSIFFNNDLNYFEVNNTKFKSDTIFNLKLSKRFKIKDYNVESEINLDEIKCNIKSNIVNKYIESYKDTINFQNSILNIKYSKNNLKINGLSTYSISDFNDLINFQINKTKDNYDFDIKADLDKSEIKINQLNYKKAKNKKATIEIIGKYKKDNSLFFQTLNFIENQNNVNIQDLKINFDKEYKISKFKKLNLKYFSNNGVNNDVSIINKNNNYIINGKVFDGIRLIENITDSNSNLNIFKNFDNLNSLFKVKIDKVYLDKQNFVNNLKGNFKLKRNKIIDLNLKSKFAKDEKFYILIKSTSNNETVTTLYSDRAVPFVKNYKFIKGFEDGVLDFESIKKNENSRSRLKIDNFKVKKVPVLAKLLTLASLQGIADLLTGEGIRFTDFEMVFSNNDKLMKIEEIYAIGPAISIMMNGYIEGKELVSLRGTLVPATTINRTISSIPLLGDILIGKKVGEGVFGVSFKIKGPPKNLKTSVNPIKTLTPRFITRTLEKIKKNN